MMRNQKTQRTGHTISDMLGSVIAAVWIFLDLRVLVFAGNATILRERNGG